MTRGFLIAVGLLVAATSTAADARIYSLPAGQYLITGDVRAVGPVILPDSPFPPPQPPPVPFPPPTPTPIPVVPSDAKALKAAAESATADPARTATAANLAAVATLLKQQVEKGSLKDYATISEAYVYLSDQMIPRTGKAAWARFQTLVGNHLAAFAQEGAQPAVYSTYFGVVADALDASVPQAEKIQSIDIDTLMKLLEFFVRYILPFILS